MRPLGERPCHSRNWAHAPRAFSHLSSVRTEEPGGARHGNISLIIMILILVNIILLSTIAMLVRHIVVSGLLLFVRLLLLQSLFTG